MSAFAVDLPAGYLHPARQCPSPNFDERPPDCSIDLLIIHGISLPPGEFGGPWIEALFLNELETTAHPYFATIRNLRVSSHLLVRRNGELVQYVPFSKRAWHAGESVFLGRTDCNDFSIGIELEGTDHFPYTEAQYRVLQASVDAIRRAYPAIVQERIAGHCDVSPDRKTDPGPAFDWARIGVPRRH